MDRDRNWTTGLTWSSEDGPQSRTLSSFHSQGSEDHEIERSKSAKMLAGDLYKYSGSNGASLDFLTSPLSNGSATEFVSPVHGLNSLQQLQNHQIKNHAHLTSNYNRNLPKYHNYVSPNQQMPRDSFKQNDGLHVQGGYRDEMASSDRHSTFNHYQKSTYPDTSQAVSNQGQKHNSDSFIEAPRENVLFNSKQNVYSFPHFLCNSSTTGSMAMKNNNFVPHSNNIHKSHVNFDSLSLNKNDLHQNGKLHLQKAQENTKSQFLPSDSPNAFSITQENIYNSEFNNGYRKLNHSVNGLPKSFEQNRYLHRQDENVSKSRNVANDKSSNQKNVLPQFGFTPFPEWMKDPHQVKHIGKEMYESSHSYSRDMCTKRKKKDQQDLIGVFPKKKVRKTKSNVKEGLTNKENPNQMEDQFTSDLVKGKEWKTSVEPKSNAINQLENQVQRVLDSIQREVATEKQNELKNYDGLGLSENGHKHDNEPPRLVEHVTEEDLKEQGRKTPDCCTNCEKLGFRNSPQCLNKRSAAEVDVFDFEADEEESQSNLPQFPSCLPSFIPPFSLGDSKSVFSSTSYTVASSADVATTTTVSTNVGHKCSITNDSSISLANSSTIASVPSTEMSGSEGANINPTQIGFKSEISSAHKVFNVNDIKMEENCKEVDKKVFSDFNKFTKTADENVCEKMNITNPGLHVESDQHSSGEVDNLAWVADHVQKIKSTILEDDGLTDRLRNNVKADIPICSCRGPNYIPSEDVEGPYYTHLGTGRSIHAIRELLEKRTGAKGKAIRIEKIRYTGKEGKSEHGCPIAKWIIRRSSEEEKYLCLIRPRPGHFCETACLIVVLVAWEGVPPEKADDLYGYLIATLPRNGFETERRCGTNERKTCACQGVDLIRRGASFSFGCSWSMYFNGCKFARSRDAKRFKLKDSSKEEEFENKLQDLATMMAPLYAKMAPDAYNNQTTFEKPDLKCRLGKNGARPFSGVTACVDFCAHAHKDLHNMNNGSTVVVTLTKHRGIQKPDDEQLHVLPLHVMDRTDEYGNADAQIEQIKNGSLEVLQVYPMEARMRSTPLTPSRKKKGKKGTGTSPGGKRGRPAKSTGSAPTTPQEKDSVVNSQESNPILSEMYFRSNSSSKSDSGTKYKDQQTKGSSLNLNENKMQGTNEARMEAAFWNYFYTYGTFPPPEFISALRSQMDWKKNESSEQLSRCSTDPKDGCIKQGEQCNSVSSKMASEQSSVISNNKSSVSSSNTQGQNHGAEMINMNSPANINKQWQQSKIEAPLDLSSSGSSDIFSAALQSQKCKTEDQNTLQSGSKDFSNKSVDFQSPLDLLSEAVSLQTKMLNEDRYKCTASNLPQPSPKGDNSHSSYHQQAGCQSNDPFIASQHSSDGAEQALLHQRENDQYKFVVPQQVENQTNSTNPPSVLDPTVVKCEMEYNERAFHDSEIGGVAIALQHGAVLFEVAKRELHATTGLRNPNRYAPTRISLVFYQHKNLNLVHHGWYEYEKKCETLRQKRLEKMHLEANNISADFPELPLGNGEKGKKKKSKKAKIDITKTSAAQYKYMWDAPVGRAETLTTDSVITRWIDPQPMVTGPYQRWV